MGFVIIVALTYISLRSFPRATLARQ